MMAKNTKTTIKAIIPPFDKAKVLSLPDPAPASLSMLPFELAVPGLSVQSVVQGSSVASAKAEVVVDAIVREDSQCRTILGQVSEACGNVLGMDVRRLRKYSKMETRQHSLKVRVPQY